MQPIVGLSDKALKELCDSLPPLTEEEKRIYGERLAEGVRGLHEVLPTCEEAIKAWREFAEWRPGRM